MTHTAFFDVVRQTAHAAINGSQPPALGGKLLTHLKIIAKCFVGDEVIEIDEDTAEFLILAKTDPAGAASLIDTTAFLNTSDPDEPQYEFEWSPADSVQLRAVLDAAADPTQPVELRYEFRFERDGEKGAIGGPIWFLNNFFRPETPAPEATLNTSWEMLKSRLAAGDNVTLAVNDVTKVITISVPDFADGEDGREIELQASATHIQWRLAGSGSWTNLVALSAITGPAGADGADGSDATVNAANVATVLHAAASKATPVDADEIPLIDSAAANGLKSLTWANLKATLKTYFDTLYSTFSGAYSALSGIPSTFAPAAHATSHKSGGSDAIKLDDLAAPDDNTDLDATTTKHGLLPKLGGGTTNFLRADGTWAAPGGSSISTPKIAYVETNGDNGTAAIGNPALPYATAQAAYNALAAASAGDYTLHIGAGAFAGITLAVGWSANVKAIVGRGYLVSRLGGITGAGATGGDGGTDEPGLPGAAGSSITDLCSDLSVNLGDIDVHGGDGGDGGTSGDGAQGYNGGQGGEGGQLRLRNCVCNSINNRAGDGGAGAVGNSTNGSGGDGGISASLHLHGCIVLGDINSGVGAGGPAYPPAFPGNPGTEIGFYYIARSRFYEMVCDTSGGLPSSSNSIVCCEVTGSLAGGSETVINTTARAEPAF